MFENDIEKKIDFDWVFVELRSVSNPGLVVATRSGLVQRDADIVDIDGVSPLCFRQVVEGEYFVAVRHRNHLGTMTAASITMTEAGTVVDFTDTNLDLFNRPPTSPVFSFDGLEQVTVNGQYALWGGNANVNNSVIFAGQSNDISAIFNEVDGAPANIFRSQAFIFAGYNEGDVNMDGNTIFAGQNNDINPVFENIDGHPLNILGSQAFIIREQLAE